MSGLVGAAGRHRRAVGVIRLPDHIVGVPGEALPVGWRFMFFSGLLSSLLGWFISKSRGVRRSSRVAATESRTKGDGGPSPVENAVFEQITAPCF